MFDAIQYILAGLVGRKDFRGDSVGMERRGGKEREREREREKEKERELGM